MYEKKSRAFSDREILLLIAEWYKYPQLYDKQASEYHDRNKRILAKENIALYLNEALGFQEKDSQRITGKDLTFFIRFSLCISGLKRFCFKLKV